MVPLKLSHLKREEKKIEDIKNHKFYKEAMWQYAKRELGKTYKIPWRDYDCKRFIDIDERH